MIKMLPRTIAAVMMGVPRMLSETEIRNIFNATGIILIAAFLLNLIGNDIISIY
jgi:hypothetical protein